MIYLDNAATTKPKVEVLENALPYLTENYGNPSSPYSFGQTARKAIENARIQIALVLGVSSNEIYFTSGSTESINYITRQFNRAYVGSIEHHATIYSARYNSKATVIPVDQDGFYLFSQVDMTEHGVICISLGNNVIGNIIPLKQIQELRSSCDNVIALDITQSFGHMDVKEYLKYVDIAYGSFHKLGGVKGCGFVYISDRISKSPMLYGGAQESNFRAGTENVFGIVAGEYATRNSYRNLQKNKEKVGKLRNLFFNSMEEKCGNYSWHLNGTADWNYRLAGNVNIRFDGYEGEELLSWLDLYGICGSSGSACDSESKEPNHVLKAIGLTDQQANSSIRFTISEDNTENEIIRTIDVLEMGLKNLGVGQNV